MLWENWNSWTCLRMFVDNNSRYNYPLWIVLLVVHDIASYFFNFIGGVALGRLPFPHRIFKSIHPLIICSSFIFFAFTLKSISKLVLTEWPTFCSVAHIIIAAINPTPRTAVIFFVADFTFHCWVSWCAHGFTLKTKLSNYFMWEDDILYTYPTTDRNVRNTPHIIIFMHVICSHIFWWRAIDSMTSW